MNWRNLYETDLHRPASMKQQAFGQSHDGQLAQLAKVSEEGATC